jgi:hypothetical protein
MATGLGMLIRACLVETRSLSCVLLLQALSCTAAEEHQCQARSLTQHLPPRCWPGCAHSTKPARAVCQRCDNHQIDLDWFPVCFAGP